MPDTSRISRRHAHQIALPLDERIARLAGEQHGIVARRQLRALGASPDAIRGALRRAALRKRRPGVYAAGTTALPRRSRWMAAVLAAGPGAALSHRSAGAFYEICRDGPRVDVRRHLPEDEHETA